MVSQEIPIKLKSSAKSTFISTLFPDTKIKF